MGYQLDNIPINRLEQGESGLRKLYRKYEEGAKRRKLDFSLSIEQFRIFTKANCFYCGIEPNQISKITNKDHAEKSKEWSKYLYNGIDRKDNSFGYTLDNSVACCKTCNYRKGTLNHNEFILWIAKAYANLYKNR